MIDYDKFELENGLKVIVHTDKSTPIVAFNLLYNIGARDEDKNKTGFAHLFEHLMFGGSVNIPHFDEPLQKVGGDNNAFTSNDITNYYITVPKENLETAFWLESDRMLSLAFTDKSLEVQRQVVIEEFKQNYLNQPYGDVWLLLRPLAYDQHPYQWATIGKEIAHIEHATMADVKDFFYTHYLPNNAILCVAGNVKTEEVKALAKKWFGDIKPGQVKKRNIPIEPVQIQEKRLEVQREVPANAIYKAYKMCKRRDEDYFATDLLSDVLSMGNSSRLYKSLVKDKSIFSEIQAYVMGSIDDGLFVISGYVSDGVSFEEAERLLLDELEQLKAMPIKELELEKVKNKLESSREFSESSVLNKAMNLSFSELLGDVDYINTEPDQYNQVTVMDLQRVANQLFNAHNCSTLIYAKK